MTKNKCACGCGQLAGNGKKYIHGHNMKGKPPWNKGIPHSEEQIEKMKLSGGNRKGFFHTEATKQKMRDNHKGMSGRKHSEETINKMKVTQQKSEEFRRRVSNVLRGHFVSDETKQKIRDTLKGFVPSEESNKERSIGMTKAWAEGRMSEALAGCHRGPNKPETMILNILNSLFPNQWEYTGNFTFTIAGKCPDFVNCNGQKKVIEMYGDYWHRNDDPQDRIDLFSKFGYDTLIIWESELKDIRKVEKAIETFAIYTERRWSDGVS